MYTAVTSLVTRIAACIATMHAIWKSWPGTLLRLLAVAAVLSTVAANALAVPLVNARAVPAAERAAAAATQRSVSLSGVEWVSPPGLVGLGPLVKIGGVAVGAGPVERSEAALGSATVSVRPLRSLLQRRAVLDVNVEGLHTTIRQADNYSWFGFPDDTEPSSRDLFPPAGGAAAPGGADAAAAARDGGAAGAGPTTAAAAPPPSSRQGLVVEGIRTSARCAGGADGVAGQVPADTGQVSTPTGVGGGVPRVADGGGERREGEECARDLDRAMVARASAAVRARREIVESVQGAVAEMLAAGRAALSGREEGDAVLRDVEGAGEAANRRGLLPLASASAAVADGAGPGGSGGAAADGGQEGESEGGSASLPPVVVRRVTAAGAGVDAYVFGDVYPRQFRNVSADLRLGRGYGTLGLEVTGDAVARDARCMRCTMPTPEAPRNLRTVTAGAEDAVRANAYPITQQGPSPASLAAYAEGAAQRQLQNAPASFGSGGISAGFVGGRSWEDEGFGGLGDVTGAWERGLDARVQHGRNAPAADMHPLEGGAGRVGEGRPRQGEGGVQGSMRGKAAQGSIDSAGMPAAGGGSDAGRGRATPGVLFPPALLSPFSEDADNAATFPPFEQPSAQAADGTGGGDLAGAPPPPPPSGGRVTVRVTARDMMRENVWPTCEVAIGGENLHAPLIERLFELPMDIYGGRCDGELLLSMHEEDDWNVFPQFGGHVAVRGGAFHFWDAPDDFSETAMDLRFEGELCHLVSGRGRFGAVPLHASGRLGMNPETGQYDLRADVAPADVNAVRATLGARPLPYPMAGAVQGQLRCYGALETPIFSGRVRSTRDGRWTGGGGDVSDAEAALLSARAEDHEAHLAYDKVPFKCAPRCPAVPAVVPLPVLWGVGCCPDVTCVNATLCRGSRRLVGRPRGLGLRSIGRRWLRVVAVVRGAPMHC